MTNAATHEGYGLAHIIDKHGSVIRYNAARFAIEDFIPIVVQFGALLQDLPDRYVFESYGFRFVVKKHFNGKRKRFLLTAFDIER